MSDETGMVPASKLLDVAKTFKGKIDDLERQIRLDQDLIGVLNKASKDWLDAEPQRLAELDDLRSQISLLESQIQSSRGES
jgi:hypothetical protein